MSNLRTCFTISRGWCSRQFVLIIIRKRREANDTKTVRNTFYMHIPYRYMAIQIIYNDASTAFKCSIQHPPLLKFLTDRYLRFSPQPGASHIPFPLFSDLCFSATSSSLAPTKSNHASFSFGGATRITTSPSLVILLLQRIMPSGAG